MPPYIPTDPVQIAIYLGLTVLGYWLRHKGVNVPLLPAAPATPPTPPAPAEPEDRPVVDVVRKILREELLPLLRQAAAEAVTEAKKG